jgi:methyl-accepting chemotaxis protein
MYISILLSLIGVLILSYLIFLIARNLGRTLSQITKVLNKLSRGDIHESNKLTIHTGDEIENMAESVKYLLDGLNQTSEFANQIGKGNLNADFKPLSEADTLGNSLLEMRNSLKTADEELGKRKIEDEKNNWTTNGLAKFSEILRTNAQNIDDLTYNILRNLINYIEVNQGTIFVVDDSAEDDIIFEIKAAVAYDRRKFMKKKVAIGEELVGRCAYERKTIYMTDIPNNYIQITSGLGTANPSALLLVPLVLNDEIFGIIELASFKPLEEYKIAFVEKLAESIASTIATVKVNERTTNLLNQSKHQAEELAAQEEEMRQNLEELQATQEEAARRENETNGIIKALGTLAFIVEYDLEGNILNVNDMYADLLGTNATELIGQNHKDGFDFTPEMRASYDRFWDDLRNGISKKQTNKLVFNHREIWVEESYTPIYGLHDSKPYKILKIGFDITNQKLKEEEIKKQEQKLREEDGLIENYRKKINELEEKLKSKSEITEINKPEPIKTPVKAEPITEAKPVHKTEKELLEWENQYNVHISELDEQHKKLIELANQLYVSLRGDKPKKEVKENFRSLIDFASYHFGNEENYFDEFDFDEKKSHVSDHKAFINQISSLQSAFQANKPVSYESLLQFLHNWFDNHFTNFDQHYVKLFREMGLK